MAADDEIVIPPPDVRAVIDKTLALVENADEEQASVVIGRLRAAQPHMLGFLDASDTFHKYYLWRQSNPDGKKVDETLPEQESKLEPLEFCYEQPPMAKKLLEVIKLVALYTSNNPEIAQQLPPKFAFVQPDHHHHNLYQSFVKQYTLARTTKPKPVSTLLERAVDRAKVMAKEQEQEKQKVEAAKVEKEDFAAIDWQDFVVVDTVEFLRAEKLPAPYTKEQVMIHGIETKKPPKSQKREPQKKEPTLTSPYTGEQIPASKYDEHVRILGLDPRWKEIHDKVEAVRNTTNLAIDDVAANLKRRANAAAEATKRTKR